jgi:hypothetical protein
MQAKDLIMKTIKNKKDFDAVRMMRDIRDKISLEIKDMSFEELRNYIDCKLKKKSRLVGR